METPCLSAHAKAALSAKQKLPARPPEFLSLNNVPLLWYILSKMQAQWLSRAGLRKWGGSTNGLQSLRWSQGRYTLSRNYSSHYSKDATIVIENNPFLNISRQVREAIESKRPVVALESAIYTHGLSI